MQSLLSFHYGYWRFFCYGRFCLGISIDDTWIDHFFLHLLGTILIYFLLRLFGMQKTKALLFVTAFSIGWSIGYEAEEAISWWGPKIAAKDFFGVGDFFFNTFGLLSARGVIGKFFP
ncbi:MAG: hypothetical protein ACE5HO_18180 [bacterium]